MKEVLEKPLQVIFEAILTGEKYFKEIGESSKSGISVSGDFCVDVGRGSRIFLNIFDQS